MSLRDPPGGIPKCRTACDRRTKNKIWLTPAVRVFFEEQSSPETMMAATNRVLTRAHVQARFAALGIPIDRAEVRALSASSHRQAVIAALRGRAPAGDVRTILKDVVTALRTASAASAHQRMATPVPAGRITPRVASVFDSPAIVCVPRFPFGGSRLRNP